MRRPRVTAGRTATAVGAALLAIAGWWVLRAPLVDTPAAQAPDIDIDPPAMRARREAALALATLPDDPWSFAGSLAPSAPEKSADKERCGQDDAPQFRTPGDGNGDVAMLQTRAASSRFLSAQSRIEAELRSSADPLDRAVADLINVGGMRTRSGRNDALAEQALATGDPRVYALAYGVCSSVGEPAGGGCGSLSAAGWARIDAGNGAPWVELLRQAQMRGDVAGEQDAMSHLASATRFDVYRYAAPGAVAGHVPPDPQDLAAAHDLMLRALTASAVMPMPPYGALVQACRDQGGGVDAVVQQCRTISDLMFERSDAVLSRLVAGAVLFQATGDASRRELVHAEQSAFAAHWSPATGFSECQTVRDTMKRIRRNAQIGEVEAQREQARKFVTP